MFDIYKGIQFLNKSIIIPKVYFFKFKSPLFTKMDNPMFKLTKYHALGNDYLVLDARTYKAITELQIKQICHRNFGLGSDGILLGPLQSNKADFGLRIFNPDGSEAEKSGNGLRIFSRFLYDQGLVQKNK